MSKVNNIILNLKIYKGRRSYDKEGKLISPSQNMKLAYDRLEWKNFLEAGARFFTEVNIESATEQIITDGKKEYKDCKIPAAAINDLNKAMGLVEVATEKKKKEKKEDVKEKDVEIDEEATSNADYDTEDLEAVREKYFEVFEKKPHHAKKAPSLNKEIADKLSE